MGQNYKIKSLGVTLLEVMLVLAITMLGIVIGVQQYQKMVFNRHVAQIKNSVFLLNSALEQYYMTNCYWFLTNSNSYTTPYNIAVNNNLPFLPAPSTPPNPTLQDYITQPHLIDNAFSANNLHGLNAYTYSIDVTGDFPIIRISSAFNVNAAMQNILVGLLKPTSRNGNVFTWSSTSSNAYLTAPSLNPNLSYMQWLAAKYNLPLLMMSSAGEQIAVQYATNQSSLLNVCNYWQQPKVRCLLVTNTEENRCDYQNRPS